VALGLLLDDDEWHRLLTETATHAQPATLRALFVTVLLECQPADPLVREDIHRMLHIAYRISHIAYRISHITFNYFQLSQIYIIHPLIGTTFVLAGDLRQTLPVVTRGTRNQVLDATIMRSPLWQPSNWKLHHLQVNMRVQRLLAQGLDASEQAGFANWLLRVGDGVDGPLLSLRSDIIHPSTELPDLIDSVYGSFDNPTNRLPSHLKDRCIVSPKNYSIKILNDLMTEAFPGMERIYTSVNTVSSFLQIFIFEP
jgi:hypothetical protein